MSARGFTLVETLVALTVLGAGAAVMVAPLYRYGQRSDALGAIQARNAAQAAEAEALMTLPYDSLDARAGCRSVSEAAPYSRCVTVILLAPGLKQLTLVITPASTMARPDTLRFERARGATSNPFSP